MEEKIEQKEIGFKVFDKYDFSDIQIQDIALKPYLNLSQKMIVKSYGRKSIKKKEKNILERIAGRISVPGHVGKKHKIITSWSSGRFTGSMKIVIAALDLVEKRTGKNPIQVLVTAIEKSSPRDEITVIEHAGARYPQAIDVSPMRRIDLAVRWMVQGAYQRCFGKKKTMSESLANEIFLASVENMESYAMSKKNGAEKQADSAR